MAQHLNSNETPTSAAFEKRVAASFIMYHGWADAAIPAVNAIDYYGRVQAKMGAANAEGFVRLYMVPGMEHCAGGAGPNLFGQLGAPNGDRFHNIDAALEAWVEQGSAPAEIIAVKLQQQHRPRQRSPAYPPAMRLASCPRSTRGPAAPTMPPILSAPK